jgi:hypothetical protein
MATRVSEIVNEIAGVANIRPISTPKGFRDLETDLLLRMLKPTEDHYSVITCISLADVKRSLRDGERFELCDISAEIIPKANVSKVPINYVNKALETELARNGYELTGIDGFKPPDGRYFMPISKMKGRMMTNDKAVVIDDAKKKNEDATLEKCQLVYNAYDGNLSCPKIGGYCAPLIRVFYDNIADGQRVASIMYRTLRDRKFSMNFREV